MFWNEKFELIRNTLIKLSIDQLELFQNPRWKLKTGKILNWWVIVKERENPKN